jgi:hypothetical protein
LARLEADQANFVAARKALKRITERRVASMTRAIEAGATFAQVGRTCRISPSAVHMAVRRSGTPPVTGA